MTALSIATDVLAHNFNLNTSDFLSQFKPPAPPFPAGQGFLHELAREGDVLSAEVLLNAGADIDQPDEQGRRPLHEAAASGQLEMAGFLLRGGALLDAPLHPFGHTALYLAVENGHHAVASLLMERGARLNVEDVLSGRGLLHIAAAAGDMKLAGLLIAAGADVFQEDRKGQTARDCAARHNRRGLEQVLVKIMMHHARF